MPREANESLFNPKYLKSNRSPTGLSVYLQCLTWGLTHSRNTKKMLNNGTVTIPTASNFSEQHYLLRTNSNSSHQNYATFL